jgi:hypothetical protein
MMRIPIAIEEVSGISRSNEPVSFGVPLQRGAVSDIATLGLFDSKDRPLEFQAQVLAWWPDRSVKWALVDLLPVIQANEDANFYIKADNARAFAHTGQAIAVLEKDDHIIIDTGKAKFTMSCKSSGLFDAVEIDGHELLDRQKTKIAFTTQDGKECHFIPEKMSIETKGPVRTTVIMHGKMVLGDNTRTVYMTFRISFFAGKGLARLDCAIHNPARAMHPGGIWDLGDKNSIFFKGLSIDIGLAVDGDSSIKWRAGPGEEPEIAAGGEVEIYQDSSGGDNWNSPNHVNRNGEKTNSFRGYKVFIGEKESASGFRASPVVSIMNREIVVSGAINDFWQNFPKSIKAGCNNIVFGIFPKRHRDLYELQSGERKTHTLYIDFSFGEKILPGLSWVYDPLQIAISPDHYSKTEVFDYFVPQDKDSDELDMLKSTLVNGSHTYIERREEIDEYGWRNFGDIYADHEIEHYKGDLPLISHYNNQYDLIYGAIFQYARTGDNNWRKFLDDMAKHVMDIDIYHTSRDKAAYNGGLFWHTNHYKSAGTATHRCYTKKYGQGGGPSNEHNYTTGLLNYYYLTGDLQAKESVISLADWVINMDDGKKTVFCLLDPGPTGLSSRTADELFHGPGRGAGNSINALLDAYSLTSGEKYIKETEKLIKRCVHPVDNPEHMALRDPENRWSYLVFFQVIGKYLDMKEAFKQKDFMYMYARNSLSKYATWMADKEYVYLDKPEKLEYPNETWAAQEMRKTAVFLFAEKYRCEGPGGRFLDKAEYFYKAAIEQLLKFHTREYVRPIAILLACGTMFQYFKVHKAVYAGSIPEGKKFGDPKLFMPQKMVARRRLMVIMAALIIIMTALVIFKK